jgi:hypothetical protein
MLMRAPPWRRRCLATLPGEEQRPGDTMQQRSQWSTDGRSNGKHGCAGMLLTCWPCECAQMMQDTPHSTPRAAETRAHDPARSSMPTKVRCCDRPHEYHTYACCMGCSLTCAARWLRVCAPVCACAASLSSMQQAQSCEQVLQTHHMSRLSQGHHAASHSTAACASSHALQAAI